MATIFGTYANDKLYGTAEADTIFGGEGDNRIYAGGGNDYITTGSGADLIILGLGASTVHAGGGNDIIASEGTGGSFNGGTGTDTLSFALADGTIWADLGTGKGGLVFNQGTFSSIEILGGSTYGDWLTGSAGNDTIYGNAGNDQIVGGLGHDVLSGDDGNDYINGGEGADTLYGGLGDDNLLGGNGSDLFFGGNGVNTIRLSNTEPGKFPNPDVSDTIVHQANSNNLLTRDMIHDFSSNDVIRVENSKFSSASQLLAAAYETDGGVMVNTGYKSWIYFYDTSLSDLSVNNFVLS